MRLRVPVVMFVSLSLLTAAEANPRSVNVRVSRWLKVQQYSGDVTYRQSGNSRPVRQDDRLQTIGDGITTGNQARAVLAVDTGIGLVQVGEKTQVTVRALRLASDKGRVTSLEVPYGQVRLQLRRFNHRGSRLEIRTPAGVSAVRGTEFGMTIQPGGKTGLATLSGGVATSAQGKTVLVPGGFQNITLPGEPPSPAVPLRNDTTLRYQVKPRIQAGVRSLLLQGRVDPVNTVLLGTTFQATDRSGQFSLPLPAVTTQTLQVTVITPLGQRQVHTLSIRL